MNPNQQVHGHRLAFCAEFEAWQRHVKIWIKHWDWSPDTRHFAIAEPLTLRVIKPEEEGCYQQPTMTVSSEEAQQLMDELWRIGLRPTEGTGSAGSLAATQKHLEDMRALVAKHTKTELTKK